MSDEQAFSEQALFELDVLEQAGSSQAVFVRTALHQIFSEKTPLEQTPVVDPILGHALLQETVLKQTLRRSLMSDLFADHQNTPTRGS
jgi:hypothetical protein